MATVSSLSVLEELCKVHQLAITAQDSRILMQALFDAIQANSLSDTLDLLHRIPQPLILGVCDNKMRLCIHQATYLGHIDIVLALLDAYPALLSIRDLDTARGGCPIHYANWAGHLNIADALLARGAAMTNHDLVGNTPMLYAIYGGHLEMVKTYVARGVNVRDVNLKGHSAVIQAACGGHQHVVEYLIHNHDASLAQRDEIGNTALLFAAWGGHLSLMQWMLQNGSSLAEESQTGHTALLSAANSGALEVVDWLLNVAHVDRRQRNKNGDTCLLLAAFGGHIDMLEWLVGQGASLNERNTDGLDPLLSACNGGHLGMVKRLLELGCNLSYSNVHGYTPLILAACGGHVDLVAWLYEQGCSLDDATTDGDSALLLACYCGHLDLVQWLLDQGSTLEQRNNSGLTPLLSAANGGHTRVIMHLLNRGADIEEADTEGYTPFLLACRRGFANAAMALAMRGANMRARTKLRLDALALAHEHDAVTRWLAKSLDFTPLHVACQLGQRTYVAHWLHHGIHPSTPTLVGRPVVPLDLALDLADDLPERPRIIQLLEQATLPWSPIRHWMFGPRHRRCVMNALLLQARLETDRPDLPTLPHEVWLRIIRMIGRDVEYQSRQSPCRRSRRVYRRRFAHALGFRPPLEAT